MPPDLDQIVAFRVTRTVAAQERDELAPPHDQSFRHASNGDASATLLRCGIPIQVMTALGLGRVETKSDLVIAPSGKQIFAFFYSPHDHSV
jgi:hypothetical protein